MMKIKTTKSNKKEVRRGRELFNRLKPMIRFCRYIYGLLPRKLRLCLFLRKRRKQGIVQTGLRYVLLQTIAKSVGENVRIEPDCYILHPSNLVVGNNVSIWPMSYIECSGGVTIGDDVSIAHSVTIMSETHQYDTVDIPIKDQGKCYAPVTIENNVWIGAKATILCGVTIGAGSIVAAGAIVTKDVAPNTIVAGIPARVIKKR